ncbi:Zinc finger, PMZ-type [Sesbania bispinosa]|nr:Zinc finger, PMZ-type [Sesbania bispinosa]
MEEDEHNDNEWRESHENCEGMSNLSEHKEDENDGNENEGSENELSEHICIDNFQDIVKNNLVSKSPEQIMLKYDFVSLEMAYVFYSWYGRFNGFAVRKSKISYNCRKEIVGRDFLCNKEGKRRKRNDDSDSEEDPEREPKPQTRCECKAKFRVHVDFNSRWWYVTCFDNRHNHELLDEKFFGMLPAHRNMSEGDIIEMNNMLKDGIGAPQIYNSFASQAGGYEKVGFWKKDMYNEIDKQRKLRNGDTMAALEYLGGDIEIRDFQRKWSDMVKKCNVEEHRWVIEMYERRKMWATCYIRGNFFAGFRITSRCEGLHSEVGKFINSRLSLCEFLQHYYCCLTHMRYKEVQDDFKSVHGEPVVRTSLSSLEKSASKVYTREVFRLFRSVLERAAHVKVVRWKKKFPCFIYTVSKYRKVGREWNVTFYPAESVYKCSCMRMESIGLPCDHIIGVLVYQDISELPRALVLDRWSKDAKLGLHGMNGNGFNFCDPQLTARYWALMHRFRDVAREAYENLEDYHDADENAISFLAQLKEKKARRSGGDATVVVNENNNVGDPLRARTKGAGGGRSTQAGTRRRRPHHCRKCKVAGHNINTCPLLRTSSSQPVHVTRGASIDSDNAKEVIVRDTENNMDTSDMYWSPIGDNY